MDPKDENKQSPSNDPPDTDLAGVSRLTRSAMRAYGIRPQDVVSLKEDGGRVVIVTRGGKKVSYMDGDKVQKLTRVECDGEIPEHVRREREASKKR